MGRSGLKCLSLVVMALERLFPVEELLDVLALLNVGKAQFWNNVMVLLSGWLTV